MDAERELAQQAAAAAGPAWQQVLSWVGGIVATLCGIIVTPLVARIVRKHDEELTYIKGALTHLQVQIGDLREELPHNYADRTQTREDLGGLHQKIEHTARETRQDITSLRGQVVQGERDASTRHNQVMQELLKLSRREN